MTQPATVAFNPFDPAFRSDPYPVYRRLLEDSPVFELPFGGWAFCRYADCVAILKDARSSSDQRNATAFQEWAREQGIDPDAGARPFLFLDPPDHTRLRGLVNKAFTPRTVEALRPHIQEIVDDLLDRIAQQGGMDAIEDLAYPLPVKVICEMMGVPLEDHATFKDWSRHLARALDPDPLVPPAEIERRQRAIDSFGEYFAKLIEQRRKAPGDDLLSALIAAEESGDKLSENELLSTSILLLVAGHETTVNLIGNGVLALLRHPDQLELLRNDPSLARSAVEEILRFDPPVQFDGRIAREDMEIGGVTIKQGDQSMQLLGAANRDPEVFPDPDTFDIRRQDNRHIAFGFGIHFCVGAPLARVEGEIALRSLVQRFPRIELRTEAPEYKENIVLRGLRSLPVSVS